VRGLEDRPVLDAQPRQRVDVEEPPVVDLVGRRAPVREPVGLRLEQLVQRVEAGGIARPAVDGLDRRIDGLTHRRRLAHEPGEPGPRHFLLALALGDLVEVGLGVRRHLLQRRQDAQELVQVRILLAELVRERIDGPRVDARRLPGIDGQFVLEVAQHERAVRERQLQLAAFQHAAVLVAENRQQELGVQLRLDRCPVDVEEARRRRAGPVLEHVLPPGVRRGPYAHVVRHEVDDVHEIVPATASANASCASRPPSSGLISLWLQTS
jgi:hypothetical protein